MKYFRKSSRNTLIYLSSNVLRAALPFLLLPFLVRELGAQEYGKIGLVASAFSVFLTVVGLGSHAFVRTSYFQSSQEELKEILGNAVILVALASVLVCLALALAGSVIALPLPTLYLLAAALAAFGQKIITIKLVMWQMEGRPAVYGLLSILMTLMNLLLSLALVFIANMQAEGRILGSWLPAMIFGPFLLFLMWRDGAVSFAISKGVIRKILRFGLPLIPHALALSFVIFVERAVLSQSPNPDALGLFFSAFQLALPVTILADSINLQFRAWSDKKMVEGAHRAVVRGSYQVMLVLALAALLYSWVLGYFYTEIVGEQMASGYGVSVILIFAAMFRGFYLVVAKGIFFSYKTRPLMYLTISLSLLFSVILLFFRDLYSVAWLNLAFNFTLFFLVWILSARVLPMPWIKGNSNT